MNATAKLLRSDFGITYNTVLEAGGIAIRDEVSLTSTCRWRPANRYTRAAMPQPSLDDLAIFVRVIEAGGFAGAARMLGTPTSTVSRAVERLESCTGVRLFHRTTRSMQPTSEGRELHASIAPSVASLQSAAQSLEPSQRRPKGRLRVSAPNDLCSTFLADVLVAFVERYSLVTLDLSLTNVHSRLVEEASTSRCERRRSSTTRRWWRESSVSKISICMRRRGTWRSTVRLRRSTISTTIRAFSFVDRYARLHHVADRGALLGLQTRRKVCLDVDQRVVGRSHLRSTGHGTAKPRPNPAACKDIRQNL